MAAELKWAEAQLESWKRFIDANPIDSLEDRIEKYESSRGLVTIKTVATKESQAKFIQETMKNYLAMLSVVNDMRKTKEDEAPTARGSGTVPRRMMKSV